MERERELESSFSSSLSLSLFNATDLTTTNLAALPIMRALKGAFEKMWRDKKTARAPLSLASSLGAIIKMLSFRFHFLSCPEIPGASINIFSCVFALVSLLFPPLWCSPPLPFSSSAEPGSTQVKSERESKQLPEDWLLLSCCLTAADDEPTSKEKKVEKNRLLKCNRGGRACAGFRAENSHK